MEFTHITPEPDEAEREAILTALAAEEAKRPSPSGWVEAGRPVRRAEDDEP